MRNRGFGKEKIPFMKVALPKLGNESKRKRVNERKCWILICLKISLIKVQSLKNDLF